MLEPMRQVYRLNKIHEVLITNQKELHEELSATKAIIKKLVFRIVKPVRTLFIYLFIYFCCSWWYNEF